MRIVEAFSNYFEMPFFFITKKLTDKKVTTKKASPSSDALYYRLFNLGKLYNQ